MTSSPDRVLYWGSGSAPAWRVLAALSEKKLPFDSRLISFSDKGHKSEEVLALNPRGQVPTFRDGNVVVNESLAVLLYLERAYPEPSLMPPNLAPQVLQRMLETNSLLTAGVALLHAGNDSEVFKTKVEALKNEIGFWESYLAKSKYVAGDHFTLADLAFGPMALWLRRQGASLDEFPKLNAYLDTIAAAFVNTDRLPSFLAASVQVILEEELARSVRASRRAGRPIGVTHPTRQCFRGWSEAGALH